MATIKNQIRGTIEAITDGAFDPSVKSEMDTPEAFKADLISLVPQCRHARYSTEAASAIYAKKIAALTKALN